MPDGRDSYPHFLQIPTRWMDNDIYGHVNNVVYYSYFCLLYTSTMDQSCSTRRHRDDNSKCS